MAVKKFYPRRVSYEISKSRKILKGILFNKSLDDENLTTP